LGLSLEFGLRLFHGVPGVVFRIVFVIGAIVSDAPDDFFGIVASREGALGVGPIALGLRDDFSRAA
jgi:hypothetical protein